MMNKLKKIAQKEIGAYSIEAAIIMIVVFLVIFFLISLGLILYEQARVSAAAQGAAERAGITYSVNGKDLATGKVDPSKFMKQSPYWRLMDFGTSGDKASDVKKYAENKLKKYSINKNDYKVEVTYDNYIIYKRVHVKVYGYFKVPFNGFLSSIIDAGKTKDKDKIFTSKGYYIESYATATINDQAEMIRTTDMVRDILKQFGGVQEFSKKYKDKIAKITDKINDW